MNSKNITKALKAKLNDWFKTIDDKAVLIALKKDTLVTGGALVSLLTGEQPNDYDVYFRTFETCKIVAEYYAKKWNDTRDESGKDGRRVEIKEIPMNGGTNNMRVECYIGSAGIAAEIDESGIDDNTEPYSSESASDPTKPKYRPRYFTTNAISLSDKIQIVIRFWGEVRDIHKNYDFVHCTCSYDYHANKVELPARALEAIINKELYYCGSRYPLCSIIRTRKFIARGWTINAGQYVKMAIQLNSFNLKDLEVFKDQLVGVDSAYFEAVIRALVDKQIEDPSFKVDNSYLIEVINRIF